MFLIPTTEAGHLAKKLSKVGGINIIYPGFNKDNKRYFPDGEVYAKISEAKKLKNKKVIVLHSGAPKPNEGLVELELILQILKDSKAGSIEVFFSYFPYGLQDKVFDDGESNVAENLIDKFISFYKVKKIYIVDPHFWGREWAKKYPIVRVGTHSFLKEQARKDFGDDIVFTTPDKGSQRRTGISGMKKKRQNSYDVTMENPKEIARKMKGKNIAVVDDILKTGGTLVAFQDHCKIAKAKNCLALITHGLLGTGVSRIKKAYSKLYLTNSINRKEANVDISGLIAETVLKNKS